MILAKLHNSITFLWWQIFRPDGFGRCQRSTIRLICPGIERERERETAEAKGRKLLVIC